ncbi:MAG TPA: hypothetical protein GXX19_06155 [Syntrophomonadaceae bacterium]|nr:hypothetical protein [Syntrophomonadaceae bacterium]
MQVQGGCYLALDKEQLTAAEAKQVSKSGGCLKYRSKGQGVAGGCFLFQTSDILFLASYYGRWDG